LADTVSVKASEKDRLTEVWFYYGKRNEIEKDDTENYRNLYIKKDAEAESADQYNKPRRKLIKSQWFGPSAAAVVKTSANRILARYTDTPLNVEFSLDAKDSDFLPGDLITLNTKRLQDTDGSNRDYSLAIVSRQESQTGTTYKYKALTSQWKGGRYAYIIPSNKYITNGTFDTDTDWTKGTGWTISGGSASCDGTQTSSSDLTQTGVLSIGNYYKITFTLSNCTAGNVTVYADGTAGTPRSADGTYTETLQCTSSTDFHFRASSSFIGDIDDVKVTVPDDYLLASDAEREAYGFISEPGGAMSNGDDPYLII
jgi:hypothetical protein